MVSRKVPEELEGVVKIEVNAIHAKIEKCYSAEKYEEFQSAVEKIVSRYLKSNVFWLVLLWIITTVAGATALNKGLTGFFTLLR